MAIPSGIVHKSLNGTAVHLPLERIAVNVLILDVSARITLLQEFSNPSESVTSRAKYVFPVPARAAVCAFEMSMEDGRVITGLCKETDEAKKAHEQALREGKTTALVELVSDDVFTISIGSIPAMHSLVTKLTYVLDLMDEGATDHIRFQLPMYAGQRYGTAPVALENAGSPMSDTRIFITANIQMYGAIKEVSSPTHNLDIIHYQNHYGKPSRHRMTTSFESAEFLTKDFVLVINAERLDQPRCFAELNNDTLAMQLTMVPNFKLPPVPEQEYIFVVDRSGSMSGSRIETAKKTLIMLIHALPSADTAMNIFSFGTSSTSLWQASAAYSQNSLDQAITHVDGMSANYGGTELRSALEAAFSSRRTDKPTAVFLLTDGAIHDLPQTMNTVTSHVQASSAEARLRVFTLSIGGDVSYGGHDSSSAVCEGIARAGNGVCLQAVSAESIIGKCATLVRAGRTFVLKNISLDWGVPPDPAVHFAGQQRALQQAPATIEEIYPGVRFIVFALLRWRAGQDLPREVTLHVQRDGEGDILKLPVRVKPTRFDTDMPDIPLVHTLAARRLITDLQEGRGTLPVDSPQARKAEVVRLALRYQLASAHTSFVAVDGVEGPAPLRQVKFPRMGSRRSARRTDSAPPPPPPAAGFFGTTLNYAGALAAFAMSWFSPPASQSQARPAAAGLPGMWRSESSLPSPDADSAYEDDEDDAGAVSDAGSAGSEDSFSTLSSLFGSESSTTSEWSQTDDESTRRARERAEREQIRQMVRQRSPSPQVRARRPADAADATNTTNGNGGGGQSAPPPVTETVVALARLQAFDGSFVLDERLTRIVGGGDTSAAPSGPDGARLWATALALAYFRRHLAGQEELLAVLVDKAMEFVRHAGPNGREGEFKVLLERAKGMVQ